MSFGACSTQRSRKAFGSRVVLRDATFQINPAEKIGLIGTNGSGKTTLLKMFPPGWNPMKDPSAERAGLQVGTLDQIPNFDEGHDGSRRRSSRLRRPDRCRTRNGAAWNTRFREPRPKTFWIATPRFNTSSNSRGLQVPRDGRSGPAGSRVCRRSPHSPKQPSFRRRKEPAGACETAALEAELLLLDEPTNHLDIRSIEWLETISERNMPRQSWSFLTIDSFSTGSWVGFSKSTDCRVHDYPGNYTAYVRERAERLARQEKEWRQQQDWIENQEDYIRRNIAGQKTKQAQSRRKLLARVKRIEKPTTARQTVKFRFLPVERGSRYVLSARNLASATTHPLVQDFELRSRTRRTLGDSGRKRIRQDDATCGL